jgi:hypothetical protein
VSHVKVLSRSEAVQEIERALGNIEDAAHVTDWVRDLWETVDELYQQFPPVLVQQIIHASTPTFDERATRK